MVRKLASHAVIYNRNHENFHRFPRKRDPRAVVETIFRGHQRNVTICARAWIAPITVRAQGKVRFRYYGSGARHD